MDATFKDCTLHDALAILEEDSDCEANAIFIEPPQPNVHTDEDSGDEDEGGLVNNLSGRQLNARCEVVLTSSTVRNSRRSRRLQEKNQDCTASTSTTLETSLTSSCRGRDTISKRRGRGRGGSRRGMSQRKLTAANSRAKPSRSSDSGSESSDEESEVEGPVSKKQKLSHTWVHEDLSRENPSFPEENYAKYRDLSPTQILELFLGDEVYDLLTEQSQKYAVFLNCPDPKISKDEIIAFVAILILSGYNKLPSKNNYWDQGEDMRNSLVYNCMRRERFKTIMRFLHCADNTQIDNSDKMWKLRPLINILKKKFHENYIPCPHLNYDESMIEYFGKHGCKQFIRGKPIRFGYKNWCMNTPFVYLVDFEIYQGKSIQENVEYDKKFGKAAAPLMKMIDNLPEDVRSLPTSFYFDNLFTSFQLLTSLKERGYEATGTVRENRLPKDIPLTSKQLMVKNARRGSYEFTKSQKENVIVVRWKDNSVVTAMSTLYGVEPTSNIGRYSSCDKKKIQVPRPSIFTNYNHYMGGTDLMDQNINTYRIGIRGKKWWWPIFTYLIDAAVCNAWALSRKSGKSINQLDFRRHIVQTYCTRFRNIPRGAGRPQSSRQSHTGHRVADDIRYDGIGHYLGPCKEGVRRRCAYEWCKSQTRLQCSKCDVGLCAGCNYKYHVN